MPLEEAVQLFEWRFDELPDGRTQISQRVRLDGEGADFYVTELSSALAATLPDVMRKMATAMTQAYARHKLSQSTLSE